MRLVVFTGNLVRHKYVANTVAAHADEVLIVSEGRKNDAIEGAKDASEITPLEEHFQLRYLAEEEFFTGNDIFRFPTLPLMYKEVNLAYTSRIISDFKPDMAVVYGSSIIREPLLSAIPKGRFVNLHLGISPYYRGAGTNFWPFVNKELEFVGSTLLHIDAGVDTGDIICHVQPDFQEGDTVHTAGCKVIQKSAEALVELMGQIRQGKELNRVPQWKVENERYYRKRDFTEDSLNSYLTTLNEGLVANYLKEGPGQDLRVIPLQSA